MQDLGAPTRKPNTSSVDDITRGARLPQPNAGCRRPSHSFDIQTDNLALQRHRNLAASNFTNTTGELGDWGDCGYVSADTA